MYGTIATMRVKPGMESQLQAEMRTYGALGIPGYKSTYVYRSDADPNTYYMAVVFESRDAYHANATSPEQDTRYQHLLALLEAPPEWRDGEIVYP
jgi:heme-degrading monooxygenase HmoA